MYSKVRSDSLTRKLTFSSLKCTKKRRREILSAKNLYTYILYIYTHTSLYIFLTLRLLRDFWMRFCISILDIPVVRGVYDPFEPECGNYISRADHTLIIKMMKGFPRSAALQKGDEQNLNCSHLHLQRASSASIYFKTTCHVS